MNSVQLIGRMTKDWELRYTPSGVAVASGTIAVDRPFSNNGNKETDFINLVAWRQTAETAANYVKKGHRVGINGSIQVRKYEKDGATRYATEILVDRITFVESKTGGEEKTSTRSNDPFANDSKPITINDDDLPF